MDSNQGAGESGKSTIVKQMIILHSGGFDEQNRAFYKKHLIQNTLDSMQSILNALDTIEVGVADVSNQELKDLVQTGPFYLPGGVISPEVWSALAVLRNDLNVRKVLKRANEFQILDSAK
jgi:guanine nucleotide-binding protein G(i) subunit alpha